VLNFLRKELEHYGKMPKNAQRLLLSYLFNGAANPLLSVFLNAYIWRVEQDILLLVYYNFSTFIALIIGFFLNGYFIRKIKVSYMYAIGIVLLAIGSLSILFFTDISPLTITIFGFISGLGNAFYWANRNFLSQLVTKSEFRNYFSGLEMAQDTTTYVIVPIVLGWFLVTGEFLHLYSTQNAYAVASIGAMILLGISATIVLVDTYHPVEIENIFLKNVTDTWMVTRLITFGEGLLNGISFFLPTVLILMFVGKENVLGTVDSALAFITIFMSYIIGRHIRIQDRYKLIIISAVVTLLGGASLLFFFNSIGVLAYNLLNGLGVTFLYLSSNPMIMDITDDSHKITNGSLYAYVFDRELFLNLGRITGSSVFLILFVYLNLTATRIAPVLIAGVELVLVLAGLLLLKLHAKRVPVLK
jgi:YQGE family putative transporter